MIVNLDLEFAICILQVTTVHDMYNIIFKLKLKVDPVLDLDLHLHISFVSNNVLVQLIFSAEVVEGLHKVLPCPLRSFFQNTLKIFACFLNIVFCRAINFTLLWRIRQCWVHCFKDGRSKPCHMPYHGELTRSWIVLSEDSGFFFNSIFRGI